MFKERNFTLGQKGNFLPIILILVVLFIGAIVYFGTKHKQDSASPSANAQQKKVIFSSDINTWKSYVSEKYNFTFRYPEALSEVMQDPPSDYSLESVSVIICDQEQKERCNGESNLFEVNVRENQKNLTLQKWIEENNSSPVIQCALSRDPRSKQANQLVSGYSAMMQEYILDQTTIQSSCKDIIKESNFSQGKYKNLFIAVEDKIFVVSYINQSYSDEENLNKMFTSFTINTSAK